MTLQLKKKKKENDSLEEASIINHTLKDEIQKQIKINSIVEHQYQTKIITLQSVATSLCRAIQTEMKKNIDLKTIIMHLENKLFEQKKMQECTTDSNTENIENLNKKIKKLQYDIDQIIQKHNESHAQINKIKERVNACRTERVIYSNVFKNIEKEIKSSQQQFKKLLIERIEVEKTKEAAELQYLKNQEEAEKRNIQAAKLQKSYKELTLIEQAEKANFLKDLPKIEERKFIEINKAENSSSIHSHLNKKMNLNKKGEEVSGYEIMFNKLKSDTGIEDHKQFIYLLNKISEVNENLYVETEEILKKIDNYEDKLKEINKKKKKKISYFEQKKYGSYSHLSKLKYTIEKLDEKIFMENEIINNLKDSNNLNQLLDLIKIKNSDHDSTPQQDIFGLYQKIEQKIHVIILNSNKNNTPMSELISTNQQHSNHQQTILSELLEHTEKSKLVDKIMLPGELEEQCKKSILDIKQNRKLYQKTVIKKKK